MAGSVPELVPDQEKLANTSVMFGPDGERLAVYRKIHMFDVDVADVSYRESAIEQAGDQIALGDADGTQVGLTICYDLRFPELYRILALRGARVITVPSAFTERTGRDHWEVLIRARAIEDQVFMVAAGQIGSAPPHYLSYGRSMIVDPWGVVLAQAPDTECFVSAELDFASQDATRGAAALAPPPPPRGLSLARGRRNRSRAGLRRGARRRQRSVLMSQSAAPDKRRAILDAAITVFAREGFHSARVSDVAAEAGVAYGLVYHYFNSKDQMLNELFSERWALLVEASQEILRSDVPPRDKLAGVANFIVESYRHEPELMKVIIVEVTRAANSFGRTHLPEIRKAYDLVAEIVAEAQAKGEFRDDVDPNFAAMVFYGAIEQLLTGWIFGSIPGTDADYERAKQLVVETICDGLEPRPVSGAVAG